MALKFAISLQIGAMKAVVAFGRQFNLLLCRQTGFEGKERLAEVSVLRHAIPNCMVSCYSSASTCAAAKMCLVHHQLLFTASGMFGAREGTECFQSPAQSALHTVCLSCTDL